MPSAGGQAAGLRHGFISVLPGGASCVISFEKRDNDDALAEIANLDLVKVQPLLLSTADSTSKCTAFEMRLEHLARRAIA